MLTTAKNSDKKAGTNNFNQFIEPSIFTNVVAGTATGVFLLTSKSAANKATAVCTFASFLAGTAGEEINVVEESKHWSNETLGSTTDFEGEI